LEDSGFLKDEGLIIGGDLNIILSFGEVWGARARLDPLFDYFSFVFDLAGVVDIAPNSISPT
jgi:hypothetical protein